MMHNFERMIDNLTKARDNAKDPDFKEIWDHKLHFLLKTLLRENYNGQ